MDHREIQVLEHDEAQREILDHHHDGDRELNSSVGTSSKEWSVRLRVVVVQFRGACITLWMKSLKMTIVTVI